MCSISEAIEGLYKTFGRYPRPTKIECCPCGCTKPGATAHLLTSALRDLRFRDLADYSFSAMTTQGSVDDFRYFLPRLFQGIAEEPYSYSDEILFHKLRYAKWTTWSQDEQMAVRRYVAALWQCSLESFPIEERLPSFFEIETVLASIAQTGESLTPYLNTWATVGVKASDEHLIQFVTRYGMDFANGKTFTEAFWHDANVQSQELRVWLLKPETLRRIKDASHLLKTDGFEQMFPSALKALEAEAAQSIGG